MRTLLDLMREHEARVKNFATACAQVLESASKDLTILGPEVGEEELTKAVAAEVARLRALWRSV